MKKPTYITLFSSAGVGCFGFKQSGFDCIATNELIPRRLDVQRFNHKCRYETGYLCGDIRRPDIQRALFEEIDRWKTSDGLDRVDLVVATPPCQGMSVANHKKTDHEIVRNSLVVESIKLIQRISPRFFIFENVPAFMKTVCTDLDGVDRPIGDAIFRGLGEHYSITADVINFKHYGACSSRTRTLVIGVHRELADDVAPLDLFPDYLPERTLRQTIGGMRSLSRMGEVDPLDFYHAFRPYPEHMRSWVSGLKEGESAFDNTDPERVPHRIVDGKRVENQRKNGDKYRRQIWDKVGPCIHTRNDQFASQNTIHPVDDRVFSIRELMRMMTIPEEFRWVDRSLEELNALPEAEKQALLKKEEIKIRQSLGEGVPTAVFSAIGEKIRRALEQKRLKPREVARYIASRGLEDQARLLDCIARNPDGLSLSALARIAEQANANRTQNAAFFTDRSLVTEIVNQLPALDQPVVRVLEPSVGVGNFIELLARKYRNVPKLCLDVVDIDGQVLEVLRALVERMGLPPQVEVRYIQADFLTWNGTGPYDLVIGNPPFRKLSGEQLRQCRLRARNDESTNTFSFFLEKAMDLGRRVAMIVPKFLLNTPEFRKSRADLERRGMRAILDFGEKGFRGVLVETIALVVEPGGSPGTTTVISVPQNRMLRQKQRYLCDPAFPYWLPYRDGEFDRVAQTLRFGVFTAFRDRQITNGMLSPEGELRVIKSRNISDDGSELLDIPGYDAYISREQAEKLTVGNYLDRDDVYLTPNMTYYPRLMKKPAGMLANGSAAILTLKPGEPPLTDEELRWYAGEEFRQFYRVARNYQTRSLNVDSCSVFFFGRKEQSL